MTTVIPASVDWRRIIKTGLAYGGGLMLGNVLSQLLFSVLSPEPYGQLGQGARLLIGIILVMIITGLGGGIGGFLGGWTLPVIGQSRGKFGYAWRSALSVALVYGTILLLAVFALAMLTMRDAAFMPAGPFAKAFLLVGLIVGALIGLLLGLLTVGWRRMGSVILASLTGFGVGGSLLGVAVWAYLRDAPAGSIYEGAYAILLLGVLAFGLFGGLAIGLAYDRLDRRQSGYQPRPLPRWVRIASFAAAGLFAIWLVAQLLPQLEFVAEYVTPRWFLKSETIASDSVGVHWFESTLLAGESAPVVAVDLDAGQLDRVAMVWAEGDEAAADAYLRLGGTNSDQPQWQPAIPLSGPTTTVSHGLSVAMGAAGDVHAAWLSGAGLMAHYALCEGGECSEPAMLEQQQERCAAGPATLAAIGIDIAVAPDGTIMVVWSDNSGGLYYRVLPGDQEGCVPVPEGTAVGAFSLASGPSSEFALVFEGERDAIQLVEFAGNGWVSTLSEIGFGTQPNLLVDGDGHRLVIWCAEDGGVQAWSNGQAEQVSELSCQAAPSIAVGADDRLHVVWQSDQVENDPGQMRRQAVLYESIGDGQTWTDPMIVAQLDPPAGQWLAGDPAGNLHLSWSDSNLGVHYAQQQPYACDPATLSGAEIQLYEVARDGGYRPEDDIIPFCNNHYEQILFTPGVDPAFSDAKPTMNGGYDDYAELLQTADYEVLFTTMAYSRAINRDSPGAVLARGIVDLYEKVKANPEDYPRGMLVRLLLGNSPTPNFELMESDGGLWYILKDLKEAGLETMVDQEIGWRVEVGNYSGRYPYSHVKTMIIDGETVVASGFNHEYKPLPKDHPSGYGYGDTDTALVVTGPVAQHSRQVYDQLWTGAITRHCPDLSVSETEARLTCTDSRGVANHAPEVMRYALADDDAVAFSMFRNPFYDESDQQLEAAFRSAEDSIDLAQAMFTMELICNLNHFFEVCDFNQALPVIEALMEAAERGVELRIILTPYPIQSVENVIAMSIFREEALARGVADRVEIRMYDDLLHSKSALIDDDLVIIGSQNLHWSGIGPEVGLNEYNLAIGDAAAAEQYARFFDYIWNRAPVPEPGGLDS
jgi:phosphatidylserine/phosphatidylglycerophosphate/cardiolipin synthase-like enzyme